MSNQNPLESVIGVNEASDLWGLTPGTVKNYCAEGTIVAKKIGKQWIIWADQPSPVRREARLDSVRLAKQQEEPGEPQAASEEAPPAEVQEPAEKATPETPVDLLEDVSYFADLYEENKEWGGLTDDEAAEKVRAVLGAYGYKPSVIEDAMQRILKGEGKE